MTEAFKQGFMNKLAEAGVDTRENLLKLAADGSSWLGRYFMKTSQAIETLDDAERIRRRRKAKLVLGALLGGGIGGLYGGGLGGMIGADSGDLGPALAGTGVGMLGGAALGGGLGLGGAAISNALANYTGVDPSVMTVRTEAARPQRIR